ncbi:uncharacterized protein C8A04DRAFT_32453 [Dichotomopilus funicola]|uniref:Uncharacterized protein n=1 Tax=Dichotomopilus funicola TaxID=1934379 RepID=A0AAN6ZJD9_9PEZI|nr:hypothetical protein C8A04DRAFT_32453 [Dichotomopilus funicola]
MGGFTNSEDEVIVDFRPGAKFPRLPAGKLILVTNPVDPVQLEIMHQLLEGGCQVRAAVTFCEPAEWLDELFDRFHRNGSFRRQSFVYGRPGYQLNWRHLVRGCHGIVHQTVVPTRFDTIEQLWRQVINTTAGLLEAAEREENMESFVHTASYKNAAPIHTEKDLEVTAKSWHVPVLWAGARTPGIPAVVRASCLYRAEQTVWSWTEEANPKFRVNTIAPSNVIGHHLAPDYMEPYWNDWLHDMYRCRGIAIDYVEDAGVLQRHWYIDVEDVGRLHVAALFDHTIKRQRLFAWGCLRDRNDAIQILRAHMVERIKRRGGTMYDQEKAEEAAAVHYPDIVGDTIGYGQTYTDTTNVMDIFERWKGFRGWKAFETSVPECIARYEQILAEKAQKGAQGHLSYTNGRDTHDINELLPFDTGIFVKLEPPPALKFTDKDGGW